MRVPDLSLPESKANGLEDGRSLGTGKMTEEDAKSPKLEGP